MIAYVKIFLIITKMKNLLLTLLLLPTFVLPSYAEQVNWQTWSAQTLEHAREQNRFILINLTATWCQYCKKMEKVTYQDSKVLAELNRNFIAIKADEAKFPEIAKRFSQIGRPGTIILNSDGKTVLAKTGYLKPQWMLWMLQGTITEETVAEATIVESPMPNKTDIRSSTLNQTSL